MRRSLIAAAVLLAAPMLLPAQTQQGAFTRADTSSLHKRLDSLARAHHGQLAYTVHNIDTGERFELRGDEPFPTASLIKVPILVTLFDLVQKGSISLDDPIRVLKIDKVPGSGMLQNLHDNIEITVRDAAWLMVTISDNTATNLLLDKVAIRRVWEKMDSLRLPRSKVHAKSFQRFTSVAMDSSVKYGLGVTTSNEMARLFALLAEGKAVSPAADSTMLEFLENNTNYQQMRRYAGNVTMSTKDGAGDQIRTECALFRLQSRVVACVLTNLNQDRSWAIDNEAQVTLANFGRTIVGAWPRK
jgi:beta-lactamase class A